MRPSVRVFNVVVLGTILCSSFGCQENAGPKWDIVAENHGDRPCDIYVALAGGFHHEARRDDIRPDSSTVVVSGTEKVFVRTVKVIRSGYVEEVKRNIEVPAGKRFLIQVDFDGKPATSLIDK